MIYINIDEPKTLFCWIIIDDSVVMRLCRPHLPAMNVAARAAHTRVHASLYAPNSHKPT